MKANHNIPFHKPTYVGSELEYLQSAIEGSWANVSEKATQFFDDYYAGSPCFFTNSCSSALEIAINALDIEDGDEIIIPGFSYVALANAVVNNGAKPVFADVILPNGNMDVQSAAASISPRTKAIIALHYAGNACNIEQLLQLCKKRGIYLIEDAAQCIGSNHQNKPLGSFGHIGCLSFDYMKNISCGQGGLLIVNDETLLNKVQTIFDNGTNRFAMLNGSQSSFEWVGNGVNCMINPIASYFLAAQLKELKSITETRLTNWNLYQDLLSPLAGQGKVTLNKPGPAHNGHIFYLITQSEIERSDLRQYLREQGIYAEHHYSSLASSQFGKRFVLPEMFLGNSEKLCKQVLRLPLSHFITGDQIKIVVSEIEAFYKKTGNRS